MRQQDRIYTALELLFFASRTAQNAWLLHADIPMSNESWAIDFCTIKLKGPRKCGHTSAVAKLVREHLNTVVLITPMPKDYGLTNTKQFIHIKPDDTSSWWGMDLRDVDAVIADCASFLGESRRQGVSEEDIHSRFLPLVMDRIRKKKPFYFIFVQ